MKIKDQTDYLFKKTVRLSPGCVGKVGLLFQTRSRFLVDLFFDYYYQPTAVQKSSSSDSSVNLGGFRTGVGIGYCF